MEMLDQKQKKIAIVVIAVVAVVIGYYYINSTKEVYSTNYEAQNFVAETKVETKEKEEIKNIIIHVTGAVAENGIVEVKEKSRIDDVIEAAGGTTKNADLNKVNLAYVVEDGQKIYIPSIDDNNQTEENITTEEAGEGVIVQGEEKAGKVNINKAGLAELMTLPGVGEATASNIIEYRESNGQFNKIEELKKVIGVGDNKYNKLKDLIYV